MTNEELRKIMLDKFYETFPENSIPEWFNKYLNIMFRFNEKKKVVELTVSYPKPHPLPEHYYWRERKDDKILISPDPVTGEEMVVILYDAFDPFYIYKSEMDKSLAPRVIYKFDNFDSLNRKDFDIKMQGRTVKGDDKEK